MPLRPHIASLHLTSNHHHRKLYRRHPTFFNNFNLLIAMRSDKHYITRPMRPSRGYLKKYRSSGLTLDMNNLSISESQGQAQGNLKKKRSNLRLLKKRRSAIALRKHREKMAQIAQDTLHVVLTTQSYEIDNSEGISAADVMSASGSYDLSRQIRNCRENTTFYPHHCGFLAGWAEGPPLSASPLKSPVLEHPTTVDADYSSNSTKLEFVHSSTLSAARKLWPFASQSSTNGGLGVLNFASPKHAGGHSLNGGGDQEECLVRQTTLYDSLQNSAAGMQFYAAHRKESDGSGLQDHAMLYSPGVTVFKDDEGEYISPYTINVVSSVPVNAATVRARFNINEHEYDEGIRSVMTERMGRVLRLFEERGDRFLVLGAFGVGQCCNSPNMVGEIWADLLHTTFGKFRGVFEHVVFALPAKHVRTFQYAFESRWLELELSE